MESLGNIRIAIYNNFLGTVCVPETSHGASLAGGRSVQFVVEFMLVGHPVAVYGAPQCFSG